MPYIQDTLLLVGRNQSTYSLTRFIHHLKKHPMQFPFPTYIAGFFILIVLFTLFMVRRILAGSVIKGKGRIIFAGLAIWLIVQALLALNGVYNANLEHLPPKILVFGILPSFIFVIMVMLTKAGRQFTDGLPLQWLTYFSVVRIFVEIGLLLLYLNKAVPKLMTFEGGNLDILSGVSALIVGYIAFTNRAVRRTLLLVWNFICLALLFNIVARALLSAPFPSQKLGFDQPNMAILYFPIVWLPTFIVPLVFFSHLVSIRQLITKRYASGPNQPGIAK